jgi:hypothetical protein
MPQRPPTLTQRLRSAWAHGSEMRRPSGPDSSAGTRSYKGSDFAARLRAAVTARH